MLLKGGHRFKVTLKSVDKSAGSLHFALRYVFPHENVALRGSGQEKSIFRKQKNVQNLLICVSEVLVLADKFVGLSS